MKVAFDLFIQNNLEKMEKIYKLCIEIKTLAIEVYKKSGKFCEHFDTNEHEKKLLQNEAQSSGTVEADREKD